MHHSSEGIAAAALAAASRSKMNSPALKNYFRPAHSLIRFGRLQFLLTDRPSDLNLDAYIQEIKRHSTTDVVRVCEKTYESCEARSSGHHRPRHAVRRRRCHRPPPFVLQVFSKGDSCIAVHCVSGLGRSPLLVAIALMEAGMKFDDAIFLIRSQRRGALNEKQLEFLRSYKPTGRLRRFRYESEKERKSCAIM
ncbi:hypothetical protein M3Y99_00055200 [Aphelenchoides fujianensis]|nr:hypothetical protein M3Y99_00055200 [Aphelenchoides fujianensis]